MSKQMDIVRALICAGRPFENCIGAKCPYFVYEVLSDEDAKRYGIDKLESCDSDQIILDGAWELLRLMEERTQLKSALGDLRQYCINLETERDTLLEETAQSGGCDLCGNNGCEKAYPDCTGICSACSHKACPCNGCENMSKWIWAGPIHVE